MLSKEAIEERKKGLGGSDARRIVDGDWHKLWLEKTGRAEADDLSDIFAVQLGSATEELNLDWMERRADVKIEHRGAVLVAKDYPFLRCTLDGFCSLGGQPTVVQAKHVNPFAKIEEIVVRYTPQVTHEMIVSGARQAVLSVIIGTNEPVRELIELDDFFATDYIDRCAQFWGFVERDEEPPGQVEAVAEPPPPAVMRTVDMTGNNAWSNHAADWLASVGPAKTFKKAETELKALVEADVREARGHGIEIKRNKAGSLSIKESK